VKTGEPKYILRFDDICPTMDSKRFDIIEELMDEYSIKPIVAVIPDNKHKNFRFSEPDSRFWDKCRNWQKKGYTIALHGYQHLWLEKKKKYYYFSPHMEFGGEPYEVQYEKLEKGIKILHAHEINPTVWVAPFHSFNKDTLRGLNLLGINIISDGIGLYPWLDRNNNFWIPQQTHSFKKKSFGVWTICIHHNNYTEKRMRALTNFIKNHHKNISSVDEIVKYYGNRRRSILDMLYATVFKLKRMKKYGRKNEKQ
jgi:predicted deacetylase